MKLDSENIIKFIEEKLEKEYGYLPGVYSEDDYDMYSKSKEELKETIKKEFPLFVQNDHLNESVILGILNEIENL